ncbi:MAG: peptide-methionine (S)-S-oxide reductase MsrA [Candidatus Sericytochromatia bacterium]|nr:peptide-methionine (S)-S-oxide reductase MsrA [Candidatus Sericytochromatia bacterium]
MPATHRGEAYVGGGCFWCLEAAFERLDGIGDVVSGYAGGSTDAPTYEAVCTGTTGHAEVVQVPFDRRLWSYEEVLRAFLAMHDPTERDRQGPDVGTQYRSIVLTRSLEEGRQAQQVLAEARETLGRSIATEVVGLTTFWPAEPYHQDYFRKHPTAPYCVTVVAPKVKKFEEAYRSRLRPIPARPGQ